MALARLIMRIAPDKINEGDFIVGEGCTPTLVGRGYSMED